jgi:hypothetical protein
MTQLIDAAYAEMLRQKDVEYLHQVGSQRVGPDTIGKEKTDCITYVIKCLTKAYNDTGNADAAARIKSLYEDGSVLGKYLVDGLHWTGYYWNPDVRHPADGQAEHPSTYWEVQHTGFYYGIKISGNIINYRLTESGIVSNNIGLLWLKSVKFAYGIARGATHCFLISYGNIYEVHWTGIGEDLYKVTPFERFEWLSGAIMVPPGTNELQLV